MCADASAAGYATQAKLQCVEETGDMCGAWAIMHHDRDDRFFL